MRIKKPGFTPVGTKISAKRGSIQDNEQLVRTLMTGNEAGAII
jgi:hypothetical protein